MDLGRGVLPSSKRVQQRSADRCSRRHNDLTLLAANSRYRWTEMTPKSWGNRPPVRGPPRRAPVPLWTLGRGDVPRIQREDRIQRVHHGSDGDRRYGRGRLGQDETDRTRRPAYYPVWSPDGTKMTGPGLKVSPEQQALPS